MYLEIMQSFTLQDLPTLDLAVLGALELFSETKIPQIDIPYNCPLVVGSGNAAATGRIVFHDQKALFADESSYEQKLKMVDGVVLFSASGSKHAPIIAEKAKKFGKKVTLITNNEKAPAKAFADVTYVFPKNREPYTYNTSTYLGPILGKTKEDPKAILQFLLSLNVDYPWEKYTAYYLLIPEEFELIKRLLHVKFMELFGRNIARDIETFEASKHATTVVPAQELFISFGRESALGTDRCFIPLPRNANYGAMMAAGYFIIGKIQQAHPAWFMENIADYCAKAPFEAKPIVE